jgi:hypothetical protein
MIERIRRRVECLTVIEGSRGTYPRSQRTCVCGFVRTQAPPARLELSSRSRSVRSAWERASYPCSCQKHRTDHRGNAGFTVLTQASSRCIHWLRREFST